MSHQIITGSCLDPAIGLPSLADKSVDVCIADPPYEEQAHTKQRRKKPGDWRQGGKVIETPLDFPPITEQERDEIARQTERVCRQRALFFCQVEAVHKWVASGEKAGWKYYRTLIWVKPDAMPNLSGRCPGQAFECLVFFMRPSSRRPPVGGRPRWYRRSKSDQPRVHDTEKPLELMAAIVRDFVHPGESIIDPYAGSGTTIVVARQLGHDATGWELAPVMAERARRRLNGCARVPTSGQTLLFG